MGDEDEEIVSLKKLSDGYSYLLSMSLGSLTKERVEELLRRQEDVIEKVNALKKKSVKDLWRIDLDELEKFLKKYDKSHQENIENMRKEAKMKREKAAATTKRKGKRK